MEAGGGEPALTVTLKPELLVALARGDEHVDALGRGRRATRSSLPRCWCSHAICAGTSRRTCRGSSATSSRTGWPAPARAFAAWQADAARRLARSAGRLRHRGEERAGAPRRARDACAAARAAARCDRAAGASGSQRLELGCSRLAIADAFAVGVPRYPAATHALRARRMPAARPAAARGARDARPDLRQVRPGALDAARPAAARHRRRAGQAAGPRAAVSVGSGGGRDRALARQADRRRFSHF